MADVTARRAPERGTRVGDYLVEEEIGRGGMGVVYRATEIDSGDVVALKLMAPELSANPRYRERFQREAELGPSIAHPNIVPIYGSGEANGELFIAMELIEGLDLGAVIGKDTLEMRRVVRIFRQAASALDAAHEAGIVHRDVKPQNILVRDPGGPEETVYLSDFGLVKPVTSESSATRTGQVFGSIPYIAPEMIEGLPADGRADVYSLACVLYECFTGQVPFERENEIAAIWAHVHEEPALPSSLRRDLPTGVDEVVLQALAKHPDDRFLTCGEFVDKLTESLGRRSSRLIQASMRPLVERVPRRKTERDVWAPNFFPELSRVRKASQERLSWKKVIASGLAALVLVAVQFGREGGVTRAVADAAEAAGSSGEALLDRFFGPTATDGRTEAKGNGEGTSLTGLFRGSGASKAGRVGNRSGGKDAGAPGAAGPGLDAVAPSGPSHDAIVYTDWVGNSSDILLLDPSGDLRNVSGSNPREDGAAALSPDGRWIAFHSDRLSTLPQRRFDIYVMRIDGTRIKRLTPDGAYDVEPRWAPDGKRIVYASFPDHDCVTNDCQLRRLGNGQIRVVRFDGSRQRTLIGNGNNSSPDWSSGGRIAFVRGGDIYTVGPDGSSLKQVTASVADEAYPRFSPDGQRILFTTSSGVYTSDEDGIRVRTVTSNASAEHGAAAWSPDARTVVFSRCVCPDRAGPWTFWIIAADGGTSRSIGSGDVDPVVDWRKAVL